MKRLIIIFTLFFILLLTISVKKYRFEGLCGNYSLTYSRVKDIFVNSDISGIKQSYNTHYYNDLALNCDKTKDYRTKQNNFGNWHSIYNPVAKKILTGETEVSAVTYVDPPYDPIPINPLPS